MPASLSGLVVDRVAPENRHKLQTTLSQPATSALRQIGGNRLMQPVMTDDVKAELTAAGYGEERLGGFALSSIGEIRAMMENGQ